jgi:hypothetical protein
MAVERYVALIVAGAWALPVLLAATVAVLSGKRDRRTDARKVLVCLLRFRRPGQDD